VQKWVPRSRNHTPSQVPLAGQHNVGPTGPVSTTRHTHWQVKKFHHTTKANIPLHLKFRSARHYARTIPPPKYHAWKIADWRENLKTYNTVRLHIQFRAHHNGQWWPETCRAFLAINIVNLSHLLGHIYHLSTSVHVNRRLRSLADVEEKPEESTWAWDGKSERMLISVVRLLFALFAKKVIVDLLVIFRQVRKIEKNDY
jgi:hypothetical protein